MSRTSGLNKRHRVTARSYAISAAMVGYHNRSAIHYSMSSDRWGGISNGLVARRGEFPTEADCSSFVTWCLWNALAWRYGIHDIVNGRDWADGWTGTLDTHGIKIPSSNLQRADIVLYGDPQVPAGAHTALYVGGGKVVSHGSEAGPFFLDYNYRSDIHSFRRFI